MPLSIYYNDIKKDDFWTTLVHTLIHNLETLETHCFYNGRNKIYKIPWGQQNIVIKRYQRPRSFLKQLSIRFTGSKAKRAFNNALYLEKNHIGTPQPLLYIEEHINGKLRDSFFICLWNDSEYTLRDFALHRCDDSLCEDLWPKLGEFVALLHKNRVFHRDLTPGNILVAPFKTDIFQLVDNNRMRFSKLSKLSRLYNLSQLDLKGNDIYPVLRAYCSSMKCNLRLWTYAYCCINALNTLRMSVKDRTRKWRHWSS